MPNAKAYSEYLETFGLHLNQVPSILPDIDMQAVSAILSRGKNNDGWPDQAGLQALLSACEINSTNVLMQRMSEGILRRIAAHGFPYQMKTFTGVFPTNSFNAQAVRLSDGAIILIDVGCFTLLEALTMLWAWDAERARSIALACRIVTDYVADYTLPQPGEYDHPTLHDGVRLLAYSALLSAAEELVLAHEHAHVSLGHLWNEPLKAFSSPVGELKLVTKSVEEEIEADRLGLHLLFPTSEPVDTLAARQICAAPYIVFGAARLLEKALEATTAKKYQNIDSHPPALERATRAELQLSSWGFSEKLDLGQRFFSWIDECVQFIDSKKQQMDNFRSEIRSSQYTPLIGLPALARIPRVGVYVRTSVLTAKFDSHERQLLDYSRNHGWQDISVYRDRKGSDIPADKLDVLLKGRRDSAFKPGGFELFFELLNAASQKGKGLPGYRHEFRALSELLKDARAGKLDIVLAQDLGRLGANKLGLFHVVSTLQKLGVAVIVPHLGVLNDETIYPAGLDYE